VVFYYAYTYRRRTPPSTEASGKAGILTPSEVRSLSTNLPPLTRSPYSKPTLITTTGPPWSASA
jgi:hypothetical protein